jgi:hypothetical protein
VLPDLIFNEIKIPFVSSSKLLGVIIDNKLKFDLNTKEVARKVAYKTRVLMKSAFLFEMKFKVILFKLFIQLSLDYSSTLFIHFSNQLDQNRLEKSFSRSIHRLLKVNLSEWDPRISSFVEMDIETQMKTLSVHNILPLKLRYSKNSDSSLINYIMGHKKVKVTYRNNPLKMPVY